MHLARLYTLYYFFPFRIIAHNPPIVAMHARPGMIVSRTIWFVLLKFPLPPPAPLLSCVDDDNEVAEGVPGTAAGAVR